MEFKNKVLNEYSKKILSSKYDLVKIASRLCAEDLRHLLNGNEKEVIDVVISCSKLISISNKNVSDQQIRLIDDTLYIYDGYSRQQAFVTACDSLEKQLNIINCYTERNGQLANVLLDEILLFMAIGDNTDETVSLVESMFNNKTNDLNDFRINTAAFINRQIKMMNIKHKIFSII